MRSCRSLFLFVAATFWSCIPGPAGEPAQAASAPRAFIHPGLLNSTAELDFVKAKIKAGAEPWSTSFRRMRDSRFSNRNWTPSPVAVVNARGDDANRERDDATAAYTQALLWYFTGEEAYAKKSAAILNAWSSTLTGHTSPDRQEELVAGWCASIFPLAGEILRASYPQWSEPEIHRFSAMLTNAFQPLLMAGNPKYNGNWELSMINGLMCIGVFNNDPVIFDRAVFLWRNRVPAYFYLTTDGTTPVRPFGTSDLDSETAVAAYWFHPHRYFDGLCQETLRDYGHHMQEGLAPAINSAEIAFHQGIDLYAENEQRLVATLEFHAGILLGNPAPEEWFPAGFAASGCLPTWEIAYNHFHHRRQIALPMTDALTRTKLRPAASTDTHNNMVWESLTHAELDSTTGKLDRKQTSAPSPSSL